MVLVTDLISISERQALHTRRKRLLLQAILLAGIISLLWASAIFAFWKLEQRDIQGRLDTELGHHLEKSISLMGRRLRQADALMLSLQHTGPIRKIMTSLAEPDAFDEALGIFAPIDEAVAEFSLLDDRGQEKIRLIHASNAPLKPLPVGELQSRAAAGWFQAASVMDAGQVYLAPLSVPEQAMYPVGVRLPVLRMAMPVFEGRHRLGVMKLILKGRHLYQPTDLSPLPGSQRVLHVDPEYPYMIQTDLSKAQHLRLGDGSIQDDLMHSAEIDLSSLLPLGQMQQGLKWQVQVGMEHAAFRAYGGIERRQTVGMYLLGQLLILLGTGFWFMNRRHLLELEQQRQRLVAELAISHASLLAIDAGVAIIDMQKPDQPIIDCNPAFERLSGFSRDEILGRSCCFLQGEDTEQPGLAIIKASMKLRKSSQVQLRNYHKNGSMFHSRILLSPVVNEEGVLTHYIGILHDISADLEAEKNRHALQDEVHALSQTLIKKRDQQGLLWANWLHDTIGQKLAALSSLSFVLAGQGLDKHGQSVLHDMQVMIEELISEMRKRLNALKPSYVEEIGLQDAIGRRVEGWFLAGKMGLTCKVDAALEALPLSAKVAVMQSLTDLLQRISEVCPLAGSVEIACSMGDEIHLDTMITGDWDEHALEALAREFALGSTWVMLQERLRSHGGAAAMQPLDTGRLSIALTIPLEA